MTIGRLYRVIGFPAHVHQQHSISWSVEANGVQPWVPECKAINPIFATLCLITILKHLQCLKTLPTDPLKVSTSFHEILKATAGSPWRFSAVMAHYFGLEVAPSGLYNTLKLALLLSLVQTGADVKDTFHNLDLLVVSTDSLIPNRSRVLHEPTFHMDALYLKLKMQSSSLPFSPVYVLD